MRPPEVYRAINAVTAALAGDGIAKSRTNAIELYQYRSIDDVLNRLAPLIAAGAWAIPNSTASWSTRPTAS